MPIFESALGIETPADDARGARLRLLSGSFEDFRAADAFHIDGALCEAHGPVAQCLW
jgi:hypothetical protein